MSWKSILMSVAFTAAVVALVGNSKTLSGIAFPADKRLP